MHLSDDVPFLAERYYVTFAWHKPSVCRLSVTLLHGAP